MTAVPHRFWSNILAVAYKETQVLRHDAAFITVVTAQPIMMLLLFGACLSNNPANVPWSVLDRSQTTQARRLIEDVQATGYFRAPVAVQSYDAGIERMRRGKSIALLVIPDDFRRDRERGQARVQLLLDGADPLTSARIGAYVAQVAASFDGGRAAVRRDPDAPPKGAISGIDVRQRFWFNRTLNDSEFFLTSLSGMLLTNLCLSITCLGLVSERERGTYEQTLSLPTSPLEIVLGKLLPLVGICYMLLFAATLETGIVFGLWPKGNLVSLAVVTLPFVLASLAIGVFVSALARSSAQAVFLSVFFILPSFVLSGVMMPYQLMPPGIREIGGILPLRWYQLTLRAIIDRGASITDVKGPLLAMVTQFAILLALIRWRMSPRLG
jgi:ABC-2 type transport system permease protein